MTCFLSLAGVARLTTCPTDAFEASWLTFVNRLVESQEGILRVTDGGKNLSASDEWVLATVDLLHGSVEPAARRFRNSLALSPTTEFELTVARSYVTAVRPDLALPHVERAIAIDQACAQFVVESIPFKPALIDAAFREAMVKHGARVAP